jgi:hypothetical protein
MDVLKEELGQIKSKLVCMRFKIERKCIKNDAKEQRRQSIHKLEVERNLIFRPKKDRS